MFTGLQPAPIEPWQTTAADPCNNVAFATDTPLVLANVDIAAKSNESPAAQTVLAELGVADGAIVPRDARHCQKTL